MEKYTIEDLIQRNIAIHCKNDREANALFDYLISKGIIWASCAEISKDDYKFQVNGDKSCYSLFSGKGKLTFGRFNYYILNDARIISVAELVPDYTDNTPRVYSEEEVFTIANNAFYAGRKTNSNGLGDSMYEYHTYTDYVNSKLK